LARKTDDRRERARERAKQSAEENKFSGGSSYLKMPEGMTFLKLECDKGKSSVNMELDFLPFEVTSNRTVPDTPKRDYDLEKGDLEWHRSIFVHRNVGPEKKPALCRRPIKKACPICEERQALMDSDYETNKKLIGDLKPQHKDLMYVIDLDNEKDGVKIFEHSYANFRDKLENELREQNEDELYDFFQLEDGKTMKVRFLEEEFQKNKFFKADRIDFHKRNDYDEKILDDLPDFEEMLVVLPYDKLQKMFWGADDADEPEKEKEPEKEGRSSRRTRDAEPEPEKEEKKSGRRSREEQPPEPEKETTRGRRSDPEPEPEKESRSRRTRDEKKDDDGPSCPSGGKFGHDCDKLDECPDCPKATWEACADKQDELKKK
jgi:hypothetical protein